MHEKSFPSKKGKPCRSCSVTFDPPHFLCSPSTNHHKPKSNCARVRTHPIMMPWPPQAASIRKAIQKRINKQIIKDLFAIGNGCYNRKEYNRDKGRKNDNNRLPLAMVSTITLAPLLKAKIILSICIHLELF